MRSHPTPPSPLLFRYTATPEIYTLSLHDALPILTRQRGAFGHGPHLGPTDVWVDAVSVSAIGWAKMRSMADRKSTRLNSSHMSISYAVFCLKKKRISAAGV